MQDKDTSFAQGSLATRPSSKKLSYRYARRIVARVFWVVGAIANFLGIYQFGEDHHWWGGPFSVSPETREILWMLAVGLGGPWVMMLGSFLGAKLSEFFTRDQAVTKMVALGAVRIGSFFAAFHCAQMSFDIKIFPRYLSGEGFVKVVSVYLFVGLAIGVVLPLGVYLIKRIINRRAVTNRPPPQSSGRKPPKTRFRRSPS